MLSLPMTWKVWQMPWAGGGCILPVSVGVTVRSSEAAGQF